MNNTQKVTYLKDYQVPHYLIDEVQLKVVLNDEATHVFSKLFIRKNPAAQFKNDEAVPLVLNGQHLSLQHIGLDGADLASNAYTNDECSLTVFNPPEQFILDIETIIKPQDNTTLSGLYRSKELYCTQCEAHGFQRITYFIDRPDVMSIFTVIIEADKKRYPVLLSNGNCVARGDLAHGHHWVKWHDPHKKPAYLFALVAGNLVCVNEVFTTKSGRPIDLHIYIESGNENRVSHAMNALKQAMRWDEEKYGREYDLDIYMIVAVHDFNMGAMENKGLNIFNAKYILADPECATDHDYQHIEQVIAHEYFHNWSGNRVTLRDWFQLSLKEGFTVFREQQFAHDVTAGSIQRIEQAQHMRNYQFVEDAGPMSHAVRPESYIEINNFYTLTVYEKGAEVIRMLSTLLGPSVFRLGTDLYFSRYDGQAVTTDDFVSAMQAVTAIDLTQFKLWYSQAGTPQLTVQGSYDAQSARYSLTVTQHTPPTPGQPEKVPLHIPLKMALLGQQGQLLPLGEGPETVRVLEIKQAEQTFIFDDIREAPIPSLLRGFSAPVTLSYAYTDVELFVLALHDTDPFCRWDAAQQLYKRAFTQLIRDHQAENELAVPDFLLSLMAALLTPPFVDPALLAAQLSLPTVTEMMNIQTVIDVDAVHAAHKFLRDKIAHILRNEWTDCYQTLLQTGPYAIDCKSVAKRSLKNTCLHYLVHTDPDIALQQFNLADNMTDSLAALRALNSGEFAAREAVLATFYQKWQHDPLVLDKWFAIQACAQIPDAWARVEALLTHKDFDIKNPNKVSALFGQFSHNNPYYFHRIDGKVYAFYQMLILKLDALNPQVAARIAQVFTTFKRFDPTRRNLMQHTLEAMMNEPLSNDLYEIVSKSLSE